MKKEGFLSCYTFRAKNIWLNLTGLLILSFAVGVSGVLNTNSLKMLIDIASGDSHIDILNGALLAFSVITFKAVIEALQRILTVRTQNKIACTAKRNLLEHLERIPYLKLSKYHSGDLLTRISDDTDISANVLPSMGGKILTGASSCIISLIYGFTLSWKLTVLCMFLTPLAVF